MQEEVLHKNRFLFYVYRCPQSRFQPCHLEVPGLRAVIRILCKEKKDCILFMNAVYLCVLAAYLHCLNSGFIEMILFAGIPLIVQ